MATTIQEFAAEIRKHFSIKTRDNGKRFYVLNEDAKEAYEDLVREVHHSSKILPDDYRYEFLVDALDLISEASDSDDLDCPNIEGDTYYTNLFDWLKESYDGPGYCDEAVAEGFEFKDTITLITIGQIKEREEVYFTALQWLRDNLPEEDEEDEAA